MELIMELIVSGKIEGRIHISCHIRHMTFIMFPLLSSLKLGLLSPLKII